MLRLTLVLMLAFALQAGAQENLLPNPGFEDVADGKPVSWSSRVLNDEPATLRTDGGHEGQNYMHFVDEADGGYVVLESVRVASRPGGKYTASAWFRTTDKCGPGVYLNFYDDLGTRVHNTFSKATGPTDGWVQTSVTTFAPEDATEVSVSLYAYVRDIGNFDADAVSMTVEGGKEPGSVGIARAETGDRPMVQIGSRLELFVDDFIAESFTGSARRILHHPEPRDISVHWDKPWDGAFSLYVVVLKDGDKVRIYHRGWADLDGADCCCVLESDDGINFTRPNLGIYEWKGSKDNNICYMGAGGHNFTPFLDTNPDCPPDQRYKAVASAGPKASLVPFVSADGLRWERLQDEPIVTKGAFDSQNLVYWNEHTGQYVEFHRGFKDGVRDVMTSTSDDFLNWTEPQWLDYGDTPPEHLYTNATLSYYRAPHIYLGFPCRFVPNRKKVPSHKEVGVNDGVLMSSRDGLHFERWLEAFLRPAPEEKVWTDRCNYISWGMVQTSDTEISLYWSEHYRYPTARLRRGTIRIDGFVSVGADANGGEMLTRPLTFTGKNLVVNYETSAIGALRFELCDEAGEPYEGFRFSESEVLYGNEIAHTVTWGENSDVSSLAGKPVRLRVRLKDGDLYSFKFAE